MLNNRFNWEEYSPGDDYYNSLASLYGLERNFNETNDELMKRIKNNLVNKFKRR